MRYFTLLIIGILICQLKAEAQKDFSELSAKQRIKIAEEEQVQAATDHTFQQEMELGHELFKQKHYLKAIRAYEQAQKKRPYNVYPKVKITDIELSMKDTLVQLREAEKQELSQQRDRIEPEKKPDQQQPNETEKERLEKLDNWEKKERERMAREREREDKKSEPLPESGGDVPKISLEDYQKELAQKYPSGITEEEYKEGNKSITKRIVVRGGKGNEYKRVEHSWGGVFYFKNGEAITDRVWKSETEN